MSSIRRVILPVMGFTQTTRGKTGMETLWCRLRELSSQATWVFPPTPWNTDAEAIAALIHRNVAADCEIIVTPYSWGCGQFFIDFADALKARGREIRHAIICDGVYRTRILPTFIPVNPWSMLPLAKLRIPSNVREVTWFFQRNNRPAGHRPVAADRRRTVVNDGVELKSLRHEQMDDSELFHSVVLKAVGLE